MADITTPVLLGVIWVLLVALAYQQWFFLRQIQILVDKAMSNSFESYSRAGKPPPQKAEPEEPKEDMGTLGEFKLQF